MARRPAWRSRWLNRRGSAAAAEIDPMLGAGARQRWPGAPVPVSPGRRASPGRMSLEEIIAAAGWVQRHAPQVSHGGQWHSRTLSCEPGGSCQRGSIRCRSLPSMNAHCISRNLRFQSPCNASSVQGWALLPAGIGSAGLAPLPAGAVPQQVCGGERGVQRPALRRGLVVGRQRPGHQGRARCHCQQPSASRGGSGRRGGPWEACQEKLHEAGPALRWPALRG